MDGIAFGVIITGGMVWAVSTLGVLVVGLAARRNDPRVVADDPWEQPEIAARWREYERSARATTPGRSGPQAPSKNRTHGRSAA